jgi:hypothetical protein
MTTSSARYPRDCQAGDRLELTHSLKSMLPWMKVRVKETVVYQLARKRVT